MLCISLFQLNDNHINSMRRLRHVIRKYKRNVWAHIIIHLFLFF